MEKDDLQLMQLHMDALYTYNNTGRITGCNQFDGGSIPRFHLARTLKGNFCVFRNDVPERSIREIQTWVLREPKLSSPHSEPVYKTGYLEMLNREQKEEAIWQGPSYRFTDPAALDCDQVVDVNTNNKEVLAAWMNDWIPDVKHRRPFVAVLHKGNAVAVCASARMSVGAHEAGVETASNYRGRGYAKMVVGAWAKRVAQMGLEPIYSTSWGNHASLATARSLGLCLVGTDFHVR